MLSILIPTYNMNCLCLVTDLQKQCEELQAQYGESFDYEILVADDASTDEIIVNKNELIEYLPNCEYIRMASNVGRVPLRNWLLTNSRFDYVLFIDADAAVISDDFVLMYWENRHEKSVIVGGIKSPDTAQRGHELRLKYELVAEQQRTLSYRQAHPHDFFTTFNVMFHRTVLELVMFDERITEYGYEDALMGVKLAQMNIPVIHIDNPLLHTGINDNLSFLTNSEAALRMLHKLGAPMTDKARVAITYNKLVNWGVSGIFRTFFRINKGWMRKNLLSHHPSLFIFNLYKLGYFATLCVAKPIRN